MSRIMTIEVPDNMTTEQVAEALRRQARVSAPAPEPGPAGESAPEESPPEAGALLTPGECAALWKVDPKTVTRWAKAGKLTAIRTPGGHRRYREAEVRALLTHTREAPPDPLKAPVRTLWPQAHTDAAGTLIAHIQGTVAATVGDLTACDADRLGDYGLRPAQIDDVRLRLALKGLTLRGEVPGKVA